MSNDALLLFRRAGDGHRRHNKNYKLFNLNQLRTLKEFDTMRKLTVLLTVLLLAASAHADVLLFSGARYDVVITDPVPVGTGAEGLVGFTLKFVNNTGDAGYDAGSVDGVYFGYTGSSECKGEI